LIYINIIHHKFLFIFQQVTPYIILLAIWNKMDVTKPN
jgi:hypothetical protein